MDMIILVIVAATIYCGLMATSMIMCKLNGSQQTIRQTWKLAWQSIRLRFAAWKAKKKKPLTFNVGKSVASVTLNYRNSISVTRVGEVIDWFQDGFSVRQSKDEIYKELRQKWVKADDGVFYNTAFMTTYTVAHSDYFVDDKNNEVKS